MTRWHGIYRCKSRLARKLGAAIAAKIQERLTREIALTIDEVLKPRGVAVLIEAEHHCMCTRGVYKPGTALVTTTFLGEAKTRRRQACSLGE